MNSPLIWWQTLKPQHKTRLQVIGGAMVLIAAVYMVVVIPHRQAAPLKAKIQRERGALPPHERLKLEHDARKLENDARTALIQALGGAALLIGLYFTAKSWRTTQEGQITDRFTKAINQLGETGPEKLAIRLGAIYALERIARDSERDHWPIMEILTASVRVNASWKEEEQPTQSNQSPLRLAADIQAILTVLGRRTRTYGKGEDQRLNLAGTDLRGADLREAHLEGSYLMGALLQGANLTGAYLQGANLEKINLEGANLTRAYLQGTNLENAHLQNANLGSAHLESANLRGAALDGANLWKAHLKAANLPRARLQKAMLTDAYLEGANLGSAYLQGAFLTGACLESANVEEAHLEGAHFLEARLQGVNVMGAYLHGANFMEAHLERVIGLTVEQLATVKTLYGAHLDPPLREQIRQQYRHLLEKPKN